MDTLGTEELPKMAAIYTIALANSFEDFLRHLEQAAATATTSLPNTRMFTLDCAEHVMHWANLVKDIALYVPISRAFPLVTIRRFMDACFTLLVFDANAKGQSFASNHEGGKSLLSGCRMKSYVFCTLLRRFPAVTLDLDTSIRHLDYISFTMTSRRKALYQFARILMSSSLPEAELHALSYLILHLRLPFSPGMPVITDTSAYAEVLDGMREHQFEICLGCGVVQRLVPGMACQYKLCSGCGIAM